MLPLSFYGASKLAAEAFISVYAHNFDIRTWIFRFANVVGPRATHGVIYDFINKLSKNPYELSVLGNGNQAKPYIYIDELVEAILFCIEKSTTRYNYYNVGVDSVTTVKKIAELTVKRFNRKITIIYSDKESGWIGDVPHYQYDLTKIHNLGWRAMMTSDEAVERAINEIYAGKKQKV
jgi:UDP-glucose 4-epimerase